MLFRSDIQKAVAQLIEPAALARYRGKAAAMKNQAVFEIPNFLNKVLGHNVAGAETNDRVMCADRLR